MPVKCMQMNANSRESGMVMAVSSAARTLPRNRNSTSTTISSPSSSVCDHGVQRVVDQVRTVVDGFDTHAMRQPVRVQILDRLLDGRAGLQSDSRRGASARCLRPPRSVRSRRICRSAARRRSPLAPRPARKPGTPLRFGDHDVPDIGWDLDQADTADHHRLLADCRAAAPPALLLFARTASRSGAIDRLYFVSASGSILHLILLD